MVALGVSNLCFMLPWQFAQFVLLTQVNGEQERHRNRERENAGRKQVREEIESGESRGF